METKPFGNSFQGRDRLSFWIVWLVLGCVVNTIIPRIAFADRVAISKEKERITELLAGTLDQADVRVFTKYLDFLGSPALLNSPISCNSDQQPPRSSSSTGTHLVEGPDQPGIESEIRDDLLSALRHLDETFPKNEVSTESVYLMMEQIEAEKSQWPSGEKDAHVFELHTLDSPPKTVSISAKRHGNGQIYLQFGENKEGEALLGEGSLKKVSRIARQQSWHNVAQVQMTRQDSVASKSHFAHEVAMHQRIADRLPKKNAGLIDVYYSDENEMIQQVLDMDLLAYFGKVGANEKNAFAALDQISQGMEALHSIGICHSDMKPQNVLVNLKRGETPEKFVISDLDLAWIPEEYLDKNLVPPVQGTHGYMAPEALLREWKGADRTEKIQNALKRDIYANGVIAYLLLFGRFIPGYETCFKDLNSKTELKDPCFKNAVEKFVEKYSDHKTPYSAKLHFILAALQSDPQQRMNATQFRNGVLHLISRTPVDHTTVAKKLEELKYDILPSDIPKVLAGKPPGSYVLTSVTKRKKVKEGDYRILGYRSAISYVSHGGEIVTQELDINPKDPNAIQSEMQFLIDIGVLKNRLGLSVVPQVPQQTLKQRMTNAVFPHDPAQFETETTTTGVVRWKSPSGRKWMTINKNMPLGPAGRACPSGMRLATVPELKELRTQLGYGRIRTKYNSKGLPALEDRYYWALPPYPSNSVYMVFDAKSGRIFDAERTSILSIGSLCVE